MEGTKLLQEALSNTGKVIANPKFLATAGIASLLAGAIGGYSANKQERVFEDKQDKRRRILSATLTPALLTALAAGGIAGTAGLYNTKG